MLPRLSNVVQTFSISSASLFYIIKSPERVRSLLNVKIKQQTISVLLDAMNKHSDDPTMMRNGCLTLCQFKIPQDVVSDFLWLFYFKSSRTLLSCHEQLFSYKRLILILLHVVGDHNQDDFVRRIAIYLLNSLACQVDGKFKQLVGRLGAIEVSCLYEFRLKFPQVFGALYYFAILDNASVNRGETEAQRLRWCYGNSVVYHVERNGWNGSKLQALLEIQWNAVLPQLP